jgi:hypothetical protein
MLNEKCKIVEKAKSIGQRALVKMTLVDTKVEVKY